MTVLNIVRYLAFLAICSLLSIVCITTLELPPGETIGQWVWFGKALLFSACCIFISFFIQLIKKCSWNEILSYANFQIYVSWSLILGGIIESIWGLSQLYGFLPSGHTTFVLTGSFFNPGPYAGYLALVLPICLHQYINSNNTKDTSLIPFRKTKKIVAAVAGILIVCILPATMSRSAWISAIISSVWLIYMHRARFKWSISWQRYKKLHARLGVVFFSILIAGGIGLFLLKSDSALGRLFIWKITCHAIAKSPFGSCNDFAYTYGEEQDNYFAHENYAKWEEHVAGSPEYAFNEYLELTLTEGIHVCIIILLAISACLMIGIRLKRYGICGAIISLLVFSFSSYPLHIPAFLITGICLLLACGVGNIIGKLLILYLCFAIWTGGHNDIWEKEKIACKNWMNARTLNYSGAFVPAIKIYKKFYPILKKKGIFLVEYGHSLHNAGYYKESNQYLNEARLYINDPMVLNIMGENYQELNCYKLAETFFLASINRLPNRIYPYYLLAKLYANPDYLDENKFEKMKQIVLTKTPKVHSTAISEMRKEIEEIAKKRNTSKIKEYGYSQ